MVQILGSCTPPHVSAQTTRYVYKYFLFVAMKYMAVVMSIQETVLQFQYLHEMLVRQDRKIVSIE